MKIYLSAIFLFAMPVCILPQIDTSQTNSAIDIILEDATIDQEDSQIYDSFEDLINNPVHLNSASVNDLLQIPILNYVEAQAIINYRNENGNISSQEQLYKINNLSGELIQKIIPFLSFDTNETANIFQSVSKFFTDSKLTFRSRIIHDLQSRGGFTENIYLGSSQKIYNKFSFSSANKFRVGLLVEKDAGEKSLTDFYSFHISINGLAFLKNIIIGDYIFEFGQGLAIWGPYGLSKSSDAISPAFRNSRVAVPFTSTDENRFFRGASFQIVSGNFFFSPFYSSHLLDASLDMSSNQISSLVFDGYHRTENEIVKRDILKETVFGLSAGYSFYEAFKIGLLYYKTSFDRRFEKEMFNGQTSLEYFSGSYCSNIKKLFVSGEFAVNNKSLSAINTADYFIDKKLSLVFSYRNFSKNYFSIHGNSFGEKGYPQNETGFYTGIRWKASFGSFNIYYDKFNFPVTDSKYNFSSGGNDFLIYYSHKLFKNTEIKIRYKNEVKDAITIINNVNGLTKMKSQNVRLEADYKISNRLKLKSRFEIVEISGVPGSPKEKGYLFFQDAAYQPATSLLLYGRIIFFQTDSYDSRIYEFENDLMGVMTNPPLYGEGTRWYFLAKYKTEFGLNFSLKYSEIFKPFEKSLGSGYSEIIGNLDNRLSLQIDFLL